MPTVIVVRNGREFDRVVGYRDADQLLTWLAGVLDGRCEIDALREAAGNRGDPDGPVDIRARRNLARKLSQSGLAAEAAAEYLWLWDNMLKHQPSMSGVRVSFMAGEMTRLASGHEVAKAEFTKLRDRYRPRIDTGKADRSPHNCSSRLPTCHFRGDWNYGAHSMIFG